MMSSFAHVLAIPHPAQGHVIPMMEFAKKLVHHGCKVTFVNTEFNHNKVMKAMSSSKKEDDDDCGGDGGLELVSIPDGLEDGDNRFNLEKLRESMLRVMPGKLEELIEKAKNVDNRRITCVVAEGYTGWAMEVARNMGIKTVAFCPASASTAAMAWSIPKLIQDGFIHGNDGTILKKQFINISPTMPMLHSAAAFFWACFDDAGTIKSLFKLTANSNEYIAKFADFVVCNSANELEPAAFSFLPEWLPVGPLLASSKLGNQGGNFWAKDSDCLSWLDQQPARSVIYVAFGSFTAFNQTQFQELALGLELTNKPFLWVARPGITFKETAEGDYPQGYKERIDQYLNESFICDVWKIGLRFEKDESGIIRQGEIKKKVQPTMAIEIGDHRETTKALLFGG
ncbi:UDP-Glycosyltransferase superfamily protein [Heracleum sosnowskyi]|uniref:UDP-Glycosyltransferase superfamily protein n=1 Tax=Heracleum sosnowskyi TaxID=360622 RepID=A0AAD8HQ96_9APIA|nr:UDP-Glycosyltransferase superfamily protein [Heracleum sosnowskyi]